MDQNEPELPTKKDGAVITSLEELKTLDPRQYPERIIELSNIITDLDKNIENIRVTALKSEKQYAEHEKSFKFEISQKQNRIDDLEKKINQMKAEWHENSQQIGIAADNKDQFDKILKENQTLEASIQQLQADNQRLRAANEQLTNEVTQLKDSGDLIFEKDHLINEMETEIRQKIRDIEALKNEIKQSSQVTNSDMEIKTELTNLREQLKEIQIEKFDLLKERDALKIKFESTSSELKLKLEELELLNSNIDHYQSIEDELITQQIKEEELILAKDQLEKRVTEILEVKNEQGKTILQMQEDIMEIQNKFQETKNKLSDKTIKVEDLIGDLEAERQNNLKLQEQFQSNPHIQESSQTELSDTYNQSFVEKERVITDLRSEITNFEIQIESMIHKDQLLPLQTAIDGLKIQLQNKESMLLQKEEELQMSKSDFSMEKNSFERKIEELNIRLQYVDNLQENLSEKNSQIGRLQEQLDDFSVVLQENERLRNQFNEITETVNLHIEQKNVLYVEIKKLKDEISGEHAVTERLEKKISDLQGQGMKENIEIDMLRKRVDDLNLELRQEIMKASEAKGKYDATKDQIDQIYPQVQILQSKLLETEHKYKDEQLKMSTLLQHSENEVSNLKNELIDLKDKYKDVKLGGVFKEEIEDLMNQIDEFRTQNIKLKDELNKATTEILLAKKETNRLNEEKVQLKRRIKLLRRDFGNNPE